MQDHPMLPDEMRIRTTTNSPAEEYSSRAGIVRPLPDDVAAVLLSKSSFVTASPAGLVLRVGGQKLVFWRERSLVCNDLGGEARKVVVCWNPMDLSKVHVLTQAGAYIETLPAKALAQALGHDEDSGAAYAAARRAQNRAAARLRDLHREDAAEAVETAMRNAGALQRAVTMIPAAGVQDEPEAGTSRRYESAGKAGREAARIDSIRERGLAAMADAEALFDAAPTRGMAPVSQAPRVRSRMPAAVPACAADPDDDFDPFA